MDQSSPFHRAIYLTGPTAVGKTAVGAALARRLDAEVVALDSMTLYRGLDVGTAKPTQAERLGVPHHLIDVLDPWETASAARYRELAARTVAEIEARGRTALFVGGAPMYLLTLLRGLFEGPAADPDVRRELDDEADRLGVESLHARLAAIDPATAARVHRNDRRRIVRALEVHRLTGSPLSALQAQHQTPALGVPVLALDRPRPELHQRINQRVRQMIADGLVDEVQRLMAAPRPLGPTARQGVGYAEIIDLLEGRTDLPGAIERIQARTRQFAKRQITWFRGLDEVEFLPVAADDDVNALVDRLIARLRGNSWC